MPYNQAGQIWTSNSYPLSFETWQIIWHDIWEMPEEFTQEMYDDTVPLPKKIANNIAAWLEQNACK